MHNKYGQRADAVFSIAARAGDGRIGVTKRTEFFVLGIAIAAEVFVDGHNILHFETILERPDQ